MSKLKKNKEKEIIKELHRQKIVLIKHREEVYFYLTFYFTRNHPKEKKIDISDKNYKKYIAILLYIIYGLVFLFCA